MAVTVTDVVTLVTLSVYEVVLDPNEGVNVPLEIVSADKVASLLSVTPLFFPIPKLFAILVICILYP